MREPFVPADGETPRWKKCYDLVMTKAVNEEVTYREVEELLNVDRKAALDAMRSARAHLEHAGRQSVRTVAEFGWIVMRAGEHIGEADRHLRRSHVQAKTALRKVVAIDGRREELSQFEREAADRAKLRAQTLVDLTGRRRRSLEEIYRREIS